MDFKRYNKIFNKSLDMELKDVIGDDIYQKIIIRKKEKQIYTLKNELSKIMLSFKSKYNEEDFNVIDLDKKLVRQYLWIKTDINKLSYDVFHLLFIHHGRHEKYSDNESVLINAMTIAIFLIKEGLVDTDYNNIEHIYTKQCKSVEACFYFYKKGFNIS